MPKNAEMLNLQNPPNKKGLMGSFCRFGVLAIGVTLPGTSI